MNEKLERIKAAYEEAKRFKDRCDDLFDRMYQDGDIEKFLGINGYKESGAVRRASMDLTRALAEMRKP